MNKLAATLLLAASLVVPAFAVAGYKQSTEVTFVTTGNVVRVRGVLSAAANSADNVQYIGCQNGKEFSYCMGRNAAGLTKMCSNGSLGAMEVMASLTAASYLDFTASAGTCTKVEASTNSMYIAPVIDNSAPINPPPLGPALP